MGNQKASIRKRFSAFSATIVQSLPKVVILLVWTLIIVAPLVSVLEIAGKTRIELLNNPLGWPQQFQWQNFVTAWQQASLGQAFANSAIVTMFAALGLVVFGSSAAYPIARHSGRPFKLIYLYFVAGIIVPFQLGLGALYREWNFFGLTDSLYGLVLIEIGVSLPFVVFLYTGFIQTVPRELEEAASVDGASSFRIFWTIVFPLLTPVTATVIIVSSLGVWNDFLVPLIFIQSPENQTVPVAVFGFVGQYSQNWPLIFASIAMATLPIIVLYLFLQRYIFSGLTGGALKG